MVTLISSFFTYPWDQSFKKLLVAFENSVKANMPDCNLIVDELDFPRNNIDTTKLSFVSNTIKLRAWSKRIQELDDPIILIDADTIVLKDLSDVFEEDFDIGYTVTGSSIPINGGVIFVKPNERSRKFFSLFYDVNFKMFKDKAFHTKWRNKYAGINQAAFGYLLENPELYDAKLKAFPCELYNAVDKHWPDIDENTRVVHIKSDLRKECLKSTNIEFIPNKFQKAVSLWRTYLNMTAKKKK